MSAVRRAMFREGREDLSATQQTSLSDGGAMFFFAVLHRSASERHFPDNIASLSTAKA